MLNWLERLEQLVRRATEDHSRSIAPIPSVPGSDALLSDAAASVTPTIPTSGSSEVDRLTTMANDILVAKTKRALDEAISLHAQALYGSGVGIAIDWCAMVETVDPNLDNDADSHALYMLTSDGMSSWKLFGMTQAQVKYVYASQ